MEFTVPQFIEREPKIVGPFTFKQFIYVGVAGGLCLLLFFILPLPFFIVIALILLGGGFALAFLKVNKTSLPVFLKNLFIFSFLKKKIYLWKKKTTPPRFLKPEPKIPEEKNREDELKKPVLRISPGSRLRDLFTQIETK
ncbi:MAG: hypothetical protein FJZ07_02155 [Candidatus Nealsonbacteria bacterium]|nr:hypothetical protein [Candidatus Nealsonbacteria bacterium]